MAEWKYTLINGLAGTFGVVLVGVLALYGALKQATKSQEGANRQALALIEQVEKTSVATRDQVRWQLRRDTYADTLNCCEAFAATAVEVAEFLLGQLNEDGEVIGPYDDEAQGRALSDALDQLRSQINILRLEGPADSLSVHISSVSSAANSLYRTFYSWTNAMHNGGYVDGLDEYQLFTMPAFKNAQEEMLEAMYSVLHASAT
jgi:hypothetical protein